MKSNSRPVNGRSWPVGGVVDPKLGHDLISSVIFITTVTDPHRRPCPCEDVIATKKDRQKAVTTQTSTNSKIKHGHNRNSGKGTSSGFTFPTTRHPRAFLSCGTNASLTITNEMIETGAKKRRRTVRVTGQQSVT